MQLENAGICFHRSAMILFLQMKKGTVKNDYIFTVLFLMIKFHSENFIAHPLNRSVHSPLLMTQITWLLQRFYGCLLSSAPDIRHQV